MAITQGSHHLGLTVPDIRATRNFFVDVLDCSYCISAEQV